jgi:hypothetical protein
VTRPYEPQTPERAERGLDMLMAQLDAAEEELTRARNAELEAENARDTLRAERVLSEECPKVGGRRTDGSRVTVVDRDAWVENEIRQQEEEFRRLREVRRAAQLRYDKLRKQGSLQQSINGNARENFRSGGGGRW